MLYLGQQFWWDRKLDRLVYLFPFLIFILPTFGLGLFGFLLRELRVDLDRDLANKDKEVSMDSTAAQKKEPERQNVPPHLHCGSRHPPARHSSARPPSTLGRHRS